MIVDLVVGATLVWLVVDRGALLFWVKGGFVARSSG
jgi:hypothetical protein